MPRFRNYKREAALEVASLLHDGWYLVGETSCKLTDTSNMFMRHRRSKDRLHVRVTPDGWQIYRNSVLIKDEH